MCWANQGHFKILLPEALWIVFFRQSFFYPLLVFFLGRSLVTVRHFFWGGCCGVVRHITAVGEFYFGLENLLPGSVSSLIPVFQVWSWIRNCESNFFFGFETCLQCFRGPSAPSSLEKTMQTQKKILDFAQNKRNSLLRIHG